MSNDTIDPNEFMELQAETEVAPLDVYSMAILEEAVETKASDLFLSDEAAGVTVKFRRMGQLHHVRTLARDYGKRLQNHLRALAGVSVGDTQKPEDGRDRVQLPNGSQIDLRLSVMPTLFGQDVAIRIFDNARGVIGLNEIGYVDEELTAVKRLLKVPSGILLVAGPTASGKSNSMYAFLRELNNGQRKIHTLEDPVEFVLPGVIQSQVNQKAGLDFPELLYTVLRHSPDVIMIGEIRDKQTAEIAIRAANSGQMVLATVHAQTASSAIQSMIAYGVNPHFLANSVIGIVAQRLVKRLCSKCRVRIDRPDAPDPLAPIRERLSGRTDVQWHMPKGCESCRNIGYDQLTLLAEVLEMNLDMRKAISDRCSAEHLHAMAVEHDMLTLEDSARINIARGITTPQEASRVLGSMNMSDLAAFARDAETTPSGNGQVTNGNGKPVETHGPPHAWCGGRWAKNDEDKDQANATSDGLFRDE